MKSVESRDSQLTHQRLPEPLEGFGLSVETAPLDRNDNGLPGGLATSAEALPTDTACDSQFGPPLWNFEQLRPAPHLLRQPWAFLKWLVELLFGLGGIFLVLSILAALPLGNLLALGYLLEAQGRVARTGKLRNAFPLLGVAPRFSGIALGLWLSLFPLRLLSSYAADAQWIAPGSAVAERWRAAIGILTIAVTCHIGLALCRGGGLTTFFRPIRNLRWFLARCIDGDYWQTASRAVREFWGTLRIGYHFLLGLKGFVAGFVILQIPTALFSSLRETNKPGQVILMLVGAVLLLFALAWVPFLQAHLASKGNWRAGFDIGLTRELYRRMPMTFCLTVILVYAFSLPLYLFKIAAPPYDALWLMTIFFIPTIYPAKILVGWAYHRAIQRTGRASFVWRSMWSLILTAALAGYIFLLFFAPAIGANGRRVLFDHHAILLPTPFSR